MAMMMAPGPIPSASPSFPDMTVPPPTPGPAARVGPTTIPTQPKYFYIVFPFFTQPSTGPTTAAVPKPAVLGGAPMGPNQGLKGAVKHFVLGQMLLRMIDPVRNNSVAGNSLAPVSTPPQVTALSLSP